MNRFIGAFVLSFAILSSSSAYADLSSGPSGGTVVISGDCSGSGRASIALNCSAMVGVKAEAFDLDLEAFRLLTSGADLLPYYSGTNTMSTTSLSSFARTYLDDTTATAFRTTTGTEAQDCDLDALAALASTAGIVKRTSACNFGLAVGNTDYLSVSGPVFTSGISGDSYTASNAGTTRGTNLAFVINGTDAWYKQVGLLSGGLNLWTFGTDNTAKSSTRTGENFELCEYLNTGVFVDCPFTIPRATGIPAFVNGLGWTGAASGGTLSLTGALTSNGLNPFLYDAIASNLANATARLNCIAEIGAVSGGNFVVKSVGINNCGQIPYPLDLSNGGSDFTNVLPFANGGFGVSTLTSNGILYGQGTSHPVALALNTTSTHKFLEQDTSGAPAWVSTTFAQLTDQLDLSGTSGQIINSVPIANGGCAGTTALTCLTNLGRNSFYLTSTFNRAASTVFGNVSGLSLTLTSGKIYKFRYVLYATIDATGGIQVRLNGTSTATSIIYHVNVLCDGSPGVLGIFKTISDEGTTNAAMATATTCTAALIEIDGTITANAGGTFMPQMAQNSATGTTSFAIGSTGEYQQLN